MPLGLGWFGWLAVVAEATEDAPADSAADCARDGLFKMEASRHTASNRSRNRENESRGPRSGFMSVGARPSF